MLVRAVGAAGATRATEMAGSENMCEAGVLLLVDSGVGYAFRGSERSGAMQDSEDAEDGGGVSGRAAARFASRFLACRCVRERQREVVACGSVQADVSLLNVVIKPIGTYPKFASLQR
jgi:hypothetical protein